MGSVVKPSNDVSQNHQVEFEMLTHASTPELLLFGQARTGDAPLKSIGALVQSVLSVVSYERYPLSCFDHVSTALQHISYWNILNFSDGILPNFKNPATQRISATGSNLRCTVVGYAKCRNLQVNKQGFKRKSVDTVPWKRLQSTFRRSCNVSLGTTTVPGT
ncbi:hypothetical protein BDR06DRAFT_671728 [Suillus hirtellus]|nr:hypothetical protein BDR06DRAFT_671728 [Suillus hirtellus]